MSLEEDHQRYERALHAMQAGVAMEMELRPQPTSPKHLRVGVNSAHSSISALVRLLITKGIITEEEMMKADADSAEAEKKRYEEYLSEILGMKVTLS